MHLPGRVTAYKWFQFPVFADCIHAKIAMFPDPSISGAGVREFTLREVGIHIKKYKPEQIVTLLRQIELEVANGKLTLTDAWKLRSRYELL
jgi:hypothetical protein